MAEQRRTAAREDRKEMPLLAWGAGACPALASINYKSQPVQRLQLRTQSPAHYHAERGSERPRGHRAGRQPKSQSALRLQLRTQPPPAHYHAERGSESEHNHFQSQQSSGHYHAERGSERSTGRAVAQKASPRSGYSSAASVSHFML